MHNMCSYSDLFAACGEVAVVRAEWKWWGVAHYCAEHWEQYEPSSKKTLISVQTL